jgi:hypothetical protein
MPDLDNTPRSSGEPIRSAARDRVLRPLRDGNIPCW